MHSVTNRKKKLKRNKTSSIEIQVRNKIDEEKYLQNKVPQSSMVILIPTVCLSARSPIHGTADFEPIGSYSFCLENSNHKKQEGRTAEAVRPFSLSKNYSPNGRDMKAYHFRASAAPKEYRCSQKNPPFFGVSFAFLTDCGVLFSAPSYGYRRCPCWFVCPRT